MEELFSANCQPAQVLLPPERRRRKPSSAKIRRLLIVTISALTLVFVYCLYSLNFKTQSSADALSQIKAHAKQVSADVNDEYPYFDKRPQTKKPPQNHPFGYKLSAKGPAVKSGQEMTKGKGRKHGGLTGHAEAKAAEQESRGHKSEHFNNDNFGPGQLPSAYHGHKGPRRKDSQDVPDEWKREFLQQGMLLQRQAQLLQRLQKQIQLNPFRKFQEKQRIQLQKDKAVQQPGMDTRLFSGKHTEAKVSTHAPNLPLAQPKTSLRHTANKKKKKQQSRKAVKAGDSLLDKVESFDGEIKGLFKGIVFRKEEPLHLAIHGIHPRWRHRPPTDDGPVHSDLGQRLPFPGEPSAPQADRHRYFDGRSKMMKTLLKDTHGEHVSEKRFRGKDTDGKYIGGKHWSGKQASDTYPNGERTGRQHTHGKHISGKHSHHKHASVKHTLSKHTDTIDNNNNNNNENARGTFGELFENKLMNVLQSRKDGLLEKELLQMKKSFDHVHPGFEPKVEVENHPATTPPPPPTTTTTTRTGPKPTKKDHHHHHQKPHSRPKPTTQTPKHPALSVYDLSKPSHLQNYKCSVLKLPMFSRILCTDARISPALLVTPRLRQELGQFRKALEMRDDMGALDLGAGLGIFTVAAAATTRARPVVAVEPDERPASFLHETLRRNSLASSVTLLTDALGQKRGVAWLRRQKGPPGELEPARVRYVQNALEVAQRSGELVKVVTLDDVVPVVRFSHAVLRLNTPGVENKILKGARGFFANVKVHFVLMHWLPSQYRFQCKEAGSMLRQFGMEPARSVLGTVYSEKELQEDINLVVWRRRTH